MYLCDKCSSSTARIWSERENGQSCVVCLGLWDVDDLALRIRVAVEKAMEPYGRPSENCWSHDSSSPSIILPGDIVYRYRLARKEPAIESSFFANEAKQRAKDLLSHCLSLTDTTRSISDHPECVNKEEQGYLCLHVQLTPSKSVLRPTHLFANAATKRKRKRRVYDNTHQQGGDPRDNLEQRLVAMGISTWTINQALSDVGRPCSGNGGDFLEQTESTLALDVHACVWRRPLYIRGMYTKTRRDVSQTPFFTGKNGERVRLGVTSVEEQILPVVSRFCCGISSLNNDPTTSSRVYGAAKFHASGREDMDVRMLLPSQSTNATGRPFVCEVIDALRMPSVSDLEAMMHEINHTATTATTTSPSRSYGNNPMGVGVSPLSLVPAASFRSLQAETEDKVKHYGCLCWSQEPLGSSLEDIQLQLGNKFPLRIEQKTPLRVLHRRTLTVRTRRILSCRVTERLDDHHFRLMLSTDAGTYVKEFVHGDLGRTHPNVSTLLGCKTGILELDCEGVEIGGHTDNIEYGRTTI